MISPGKINMSLKLKYKDKNLRIAKELYMTNNNNQKINAWKISADKQQQGNNNKARARKVLKSTDSANSLPQQDNWIKKFIE